MADLGDLKPLDSNVPVQAKKEEVESLNSVVERKIDPESQDNQLNPIQNIPGDRMEKGITEGITGGLPPVEHLPRVIRRRIPSPVFLPSFNFSDKAFFGGLTLVTIASFITRLYKLGLPTHVA